MRIGSYSHILCQIMYSAHMVYDLHLNHILNE